LTRTSRSRPCRYSRSLHKSTSMAT
jgi:hypothetical protein